MTNTSRLLAFAQLMRIPNVFTAFADIALACAVIASLLPAAGFAFWVAAILMALASGCLYCAGMVWNDVFDRAEDAAARPNRPLPSGRVRVRTAIGIGVGLIAAGLALAAIAGLPAVGEAAGWNPEPLAYAAGIVLAVLLYDGILKRTPIGPIGMGTCRFLNVLFGLSIVPNALDLSLRLLLAGVVGVYIVGVTWFARTEEGRSDRRQLLSASCVIGLSLALAVLLKSELPPISGAVLPWLFPYLLVLFGFFIGRPMARAIAAGGPREVQAAVKRCVLGLVGLDAVLATAVAGVPGLLIVLLLPPALVIGRRVYST